MTLLFELNQEPLAEAVVRRRDEQDPHRTGACVALKTCSFMCLLPNCLGDGRWEQARCALREANPHSHPDLRWRYLVFGGLSNIRQLEQRLHVLKNPKNERTRDILRRVIHAM
jgi:hypothetical protein